MSNNGIKRKGVIKGGLSIDTSSLFRCRAGGYAARSPAAAFDSSWAMVLQPTMTEATAGFFRHQAKAHWGMFCPGGSSSRLIFSTNSSCRLLNSAPPSWVFPGTSITAPFVKWPAGFAARPLDH